MIEAAKACTRCGVVKPMDEFVRESRNRSGYGSRCKACVNAHVKEWAQKNKESNLERIQNWRRKNPEKVKAWNSQEKKGVQKKREIENLLPGYVAQIMELKVSDLTPELLELKRQQLILRRMARQLKEAANESSEDPRGITGEHGAGCNAGRPAPHCGEQPAGACQEGDQRDGCRGDGEGSGLDQQQPER